MATVSKNGFHLHLWRGERMCLIGMDVEVPEPDLVGFAIEVKSPGASRYSPLRNRLAFEYGTGAEVDGSSQFPSPMAPFQKFRWIHFPQEPKPGAYRYRVTKMHMPHDGQVVRGTELVADIDLDPVTCPGFLDIGFTRNFASSQIYRERFGNRADILPKTAAKGFGFVPPADAGPVYQWLGFEAAETILALLGEAATDQSLSIDFFAYDLNIAAVVDPLRALGHRLCVLLDDSAEHGHADSAETQFAAALTAAGATVRRAHFGNLQHNKVIVVKRGGVPERVLLGSTNFSYRGLYIQANNVLLFSDAAIATLFADYFEVAFAGTAGFSANDLAKRWHAFAKPGKPSVHIALSPHADTDLSLTPVGAAIDQASSSVFYAVAFLGQTRSGPVRGALDRLIGRPLFSYGTTDKRGGMAVNKPDGSVALVDFNYLSKNAPPPFGAEWRGGAGINIHNKFVVTDFNLPTAKVFTGSSNLSPSGEGANGDHLLMIEDQAVATAYAIEAVRIFDHLHFRSTMKEAGAAPAGEATPPKPLKLRKPTAISGEPAWFEKYYRPDSQYARDRVLFGR